jgi:hypothetical protein
MSGPGTGSSSGPAQGDGCPPGRGDFAELLKCCEQIVKRLDKIHRLLEGAVGPRPRGVKKQAKKRAR